jgi:putative FmdB family regulatory protein
MPTYEYACTACGQHLEVHQRLTDDPLTTCGACGGALRKVFHPAGIVFKGSGFYATDSRSGSKSSAGSSGGSTGSSDAAGSPTTSTAPAASSDGGSGSTATADAGSSAAPAAKPAATKATT